VKRLAALAFFIFLLAVAYWADSGTMPAPLKFVSAFPNGDRLGHFVLYGILAYLVSAAFPSRWVRSAAAASARRPAGLLATLEEISQIFIPARTPDLVDLAAGYLGILVATFIFNRQFAPKSPGTAEGTSDADPP
jgi:VanZ family protein